MDINLEKINTIYFIGIGGIAMSAVAGIAKLKGFEVFGSDSGVYSPAKDILEKNQIEYFDSFSSDNLTDIKIDLVVVGAGITYDNPELLQIESKEIPNCSFPEFLKSLAESEIRIVVAGTHGKSTTTGLLGWSLFNIDNSSFFTGAVMQELDANFALGDGRYFVFEGDEYKSRSDDPTPKFHYYQPDILLLTNLEYDHPDVFESFEALEDEFALLINNLPDDGLVVYNADDAALAKLIFQTNRLAFSYGYDPSSTVQIMSLEKNSSGLNLTLSLRLGDQVLVENYQSHLYGEMNAYNITSVITLLRTLGFPYDLVSSVIQTFPGTKRRLELVSEVGGIKIFDDYAHHPTAVARTLEALRDSFPNKKITVVFEPHTYSRTHALIGELAGSFNHADRVILVPIYAAREKHLSDLISDSEVYSKISEVFPNTTQLSGKQEVINFLKINSEPDDIIVFMSVGEFNQTAKDLALELESVV